MLYSFSRTSSRMPRLLPSFAKHLLPRSRNYLERVHGQRRNRDGTTFSWSPPAAPRRIPRRMDMVNMVGMPHLGKRQHCRTQCLPQTISANFTRIKPKSFFKCDLSVDYKSPQLLDQCVFIFGIMPTRVYRKLLNY